MNKTQAAAAIASGAFDVAAQEQAAKRGLILAGLRAWEGGWALIAHAPWAVTPRGTVKVSGARALFRGRSKADVVASVLRETRCGGC